MIGNKITLKDSHPIRTEEATSASSLPSAHQEKLNPLLMAAVYQTEKSQDAIHPSQAASDKAQPVYSYTVVGGTI